MWAVALWDEKKQELLLSRDRIGQKPLHYAVYDNSFIFGSETKTVIEYCIPKIPNLELLEIYLSLIYVTAPFTFFKNIQKLKAGHYILVRENDVKEFKYWDLPQIDEDQMMMNKREVYENFQELLIDSVKLRMRSDVL